VPGGWGFPRDARGAEASEPRERQRCDGRTRGRLTETRGSAVTSLVSSELSDDQIRNPLEVASIVRRQFEAKLQSGRTDQQIFEWQRNAALRCLA